jgi:hypothetical protein
MFIVGICSKCGGVSHTWCIESKNMYIGFGTQQFLFSLQSQLMEYSVKTQP